MTIRTNRRLVFTAALVAAEFGAQAYGQDNARQASADAPALEEIVVTAQRREERLRDVPISVTALSGDDLEKAGVENVHGLQNVTPGLQMERIGTYQIPALRGVGAVLTDPTTDAAVGIFLDDVYQPGLATTALDLPDIERVEVLKGPQGTLFGRNTSGGAIRVITKSPSYDLAGSVTASYGNFDAASIKGFISGPIVADKVAASIAVHVERSDSYYRNVVPGQSAIVGSRAEPEPNKSILVRGKLKFDPTEDLSILITGRYSNSKQSTLYSALNGNSANKLLDPNTITATRPWDVALNSLSALSVEVRDVSSKINLNLGPGVLSSVTSYTKGTTVQVQDSDGAFGPSGLTNMFYPTQAEHWFSQDLTYTSTLNGPLNFIGGVSYFNGRGAWDPLGVDLGFGPQNGITIYGTGKVESIAGFGEATLKATEHLTLIGGLRYSWEKRSMSSDVLVGGVDLPKPSGDLTFRGERTWDKFTPRVSVSYALTDLDNIYFTYSQGFKSGLINTNYVGPPETLDVVDPETISAYEVGYKGNPIDAVTLNLAAFYYDEKNVQESIYQIVTDELGNQVPLSRSLNAANIEIKGVDADATINFGQSFNLRIAAAYLDATIKSFPNAGRNVPRLDANGNPLNDGNQTLEYDASGQTNILSPKYTMTITPTAHATVAGGELTLTGSVYYSSKTYYTFDHRISQGGYVTLGARASWSPDNSGLTYSVYGENLTNKAILGGAFIFPTGDNVLYKPPRTFGASVQYRF